MKFIGVSLFASLITVTAFASPKTDSARKEIEKVLSDSNYHGGIEIKNSRTGAEISINADEKFPMASVFKFPISIAILKKVESGELKLSQKYHLKKSDVVVALGGPITEKYPQGNVDLSLDELLKYMVSDSDNTACDYLIGVAGGPAKVTEALRKLRVENITVSRTEAEAAKTSNDPGPQGLDTATPKAIVSLYEMLRDGKLLNPDLKQHLLTLMTESTNPPHISRNLPKDLKIAHKSGRCHKNLCVNDTAMITLPGAKGEVLMAIFVDGNVTFDSGSAVISKISKIGYDAVIE